MTGGTSELETYPIDPGQQREAIGDSDPVAATTLGLKNLRRVSAMLVPATTRPGEPYDDLAEAYLALVTQWRLELGHVADLVGGIDSREVYPGQTGTRFASVPARPAGRRGPVPARQRLRRARRPDESGYAEPHRTGGRRIANPQRADVTVERVAPVVTPRSDGARRPPTAGLHAAPVADGSAKGMWGDLRRRPSRSNLSSERAARLPRRGRQSAQRLGSDDR